MRDPAIGETLVSHEDLTRRMAELGKEISADYEGRDLLMIGVLKGAVLFIADLMRHLTSPARSTSWRSPATARRSTPPGWCGSSRTSTRRSTDRDVLIVEDIIDSGLTLQYLLRNLRARNPRSLEVCALLTKPERRRVDLPIRYVGFEIPNRFAIGYGLDHGQKYRNLDHVAALAEGFR